MYVLSTSVEDKFCSNFPRIYKKYLIGTPHNIGRKSIDIYHFTGKIKANGEKWRKVGKSGKKCVFRRV
jgi:hypothetical protein